VISREADRAARRAGSLLPSLFGFDAISLPVPVYSSFQISVAVERCVESFVRAQRFEELGLAEVSIICVSFGRNLVVVRVEGEAS